MLLFPPPSDDKDTPTSSPGAVRKAAAKKLANAWTCIKKFSPVQKIKNTHWAVRSRKKFGESRLSQSQPDISSSNLVGLTYGHRRSRDDMDLVLGRNNNLTNPKESLLTGIEEDEGGRCSQLDRMSTTTQEHFLNSVSKRCALKYAEIKGCLCPRL